MSQISLQVDDDGAVIITIQPGALPLGDMMARALQGIPRVTQDEDATPETAEVEEEEEERRSNNHHDAIQRWIAANGPVSPADVRAAFKHLAPSTVKRALKALEDEGIITASGTTSNRKLQVA